MSLYGLLITVALIRFIKKFSGKTGPLQLNRSYTFVFKAYKNLAWLKQIVLTAEWHGVLRRVAQRKILSAPLRSPEPSRMIPLRASAVNPRFPIHGRSCSVRDKTRVEKTVL